MRFSLQIDKQKLTHYIMIYVLICYQGAPLIGLLGTRIFYGGVLLVGGLYLIQRPWLNKYTMFIAGLLVLTLSSFFITSGDLTIASCFSIVTRFLIVIMAIDYDPENFLKRFIDIVTVLAAVSVVVYAINMLLGYGALSWLYNLMYKTYNADSGYTSYGLFLVRIIPNSPRNNGLFGEPGQYAALLIPAIYMLIFKAEGLYERKQYTFRLIALGAAILTCQSTAGYLAIIGIIAVLLCTKTEYSGRTKGIVFIVAIGLFVYITRFAGENNFIQTNFIGKLFDSSGDFDLSVSSGSARVDGFSNVLNLYRSYPSAFWGIGTESNLVNADACSGLLNILIMYGIPTFVYMHSYLAYITFKYNSFWEAVGIVYVFLAMCLSQPNILFASLVLLVMYSYIMNDYEFNKDETDMDKDNSLIYSEN